MSPKKAHSRAVQAAVKLMRDRLYAPRSKFPSSSSRNKCRRSRQSAGSRSQLALPLGDHRTVRPRLRPHPP